MRKIVRVKGHLQKIPGRRKKTLVRGHIRSAPGRPNLKKRR